MSPADPRQLLQDAPVHRQHDLALALGAVAEPFAGLAGADETPAEPLAQVASALRRRPSPAEVLRLRDTLMTAPAMGADRHDEPEPPSWYAYRALCTWVYAANAFAGGPGAGAADAYTAVSDLLDLLQDDLGLTGLCDRLDDGVVHALRGENEGLAGLAAAAPGLARRVAAMYRPADGDPRPATGGPAPR